MPGGPVRPDAHRGRRAGRPALLPGVRSRSRRLLVRPAHRGRRGDRLGAALPPGPVLRGRGTADPRVGRPGRARAGQPAQPGRRGDPRRDRRPDRAAQQARRHRRAEADVRPGHDDEVAARAAPGRPRPLQADQRPARARGGRSGPGERRRGAPRRAAEPGLRRPQRRGGVRGPAARHRYRRGARDRRADPRGDRGDLPPGHRRIGHGLHRRGRLPGPREHPGPARAPRRRGPVRGQAAGPQPRRARPRWPRWPRWPSGRAGLRRWHGRHPGRSSRAVGQRFRAGAGARGRPGVTAPGSAWPTGRGRSAARAWSAGSRPRPSRPCRAAPRWSARPS